MNREKALLCRTLELIYMLGYDSGFTNPDIAELVSDIKAFVEPEKPKYIVHIPSGCCYPLEADGKTVIICGAELQPTVDGEIFWRYSDEYFEKEIIPSDPYAGH